MRLYIFLVLLILTTTVKGQVERQLEGTWKLIALSDDEIYYHIKKDSVAFRGAGNIDSASARAAFTSLLSVMGETFYIFQKNGQFLITYDGKSDGVGNYTVDPKLRIVTLKGKRNGVDFTEKMKFQLEKNELVLTILEDSPVMRLTFEKQK